MGSNKRTLQQHPLAVCSTTRHRASRMDSSEQPLAVISRTRFSPASKHSARFRSSMSVLVPNHLTTLPSWSNDGVARKRNQRYTPSKQRRRASISPPSPEGGTDRQYSTSPFRSSG